MSETIKYGIINEDYFQIRSPRIIDSDEFNSLSAALAGAAEMIEDGVAEQVSVVRCKYSLKHDCWYELSDGGSIQIASHNWVDDEEFEVARVERRKARALAKMAAAVQG